MSEQEQFPQEIQRDGKRWVRTRLFKSYGWCCREHKAPMPPIIGAEYVEMSDDC